MVQWLNRDHTYNHPWERVSLAFWRKYPNPLSPHVKSIEVLDRHIDKQGRLHTTRLITCKGHIPDWVAAFIGGENSVHVLEKSIVDRDNKVLMMKSQNLCYSSLLQVEELCTYAPDEGNEESRTKFTQVAKITVPVWGFQSKAESLTLSTYHANAHKGLAVMEKLCEIIKDELSSDSSSPDMTEEVQLSV